MFTETTENFVYDDGGRRAAGYLGHTSDCVTRSIAIAAQQPYQDVYELINEVAKGERPKGKRRDVSSARTGVYKQTTKKICLYFGGIWTPTMQIGSGCKVHLRPEELPMGWLAVSVSNHLTAVINGAIHDTHDPTRGGNRCVYGYWSFPTCSR